MSHLITFAAGMIVGVTLLMIWAVLGNEDDDS